MTPEQAVEEWRESQRITAEALHDLQNAHAEQQVADEELVLAEARCIQASRHLAQCKAEEKKAHAVYRSLLTVEAEPSR